MGTPRTAKGCGLGERRPGRGADRRM